MTVNEEGVICLPPAEEGDTTQIFGKIPGKLNNNSFS